MRARALAAAVAVAALVVPLLVVTPASAHNPSLYYSAYQISYTVELEDLPGLAGYVNVPLQPPIPVSEGASGDEGLVAITNFDPVAHAFAECVKACDTANGVPGIWSPGDESVPKDMRARFPAVPIPPGPNSRVSDADMAKLSAAFGAQPPGSDYIIMCTVHPWIRARLHVSGSG